MDDILIIDSLIKNYNNKIILNNIYLSWKKGEVIGLFGKNGAGKTTFMKVSSGNDNNNQVFIKYKKKVYSKKNVKKLICYCPPYIILPKNISLKKLTCLLLESDKSYEFFEDLNIKNYQNELIKNIPTGIQKYIQVKFFLFYYTKFLFLDEPFLGISPKLIEDLITLIYIQKKNKGIMISDHQYDFILNISDINFIINDGSLIQIKSKEDLISYNYIR